MRKITKDNDKYHRWFHFWGDPKQKARSNEIRRRLWILLGALVDLLRLVNLCPIFLSFKFLVPCRSVRLPQAGLSPTPEYLLTFPVWCWCWPRYYAYFFGATFTPFKATCLPCSLFQSELLALQKSLPTYLPVYLLTSLSPLFSSSFSFSCSW